MTTSWGLTVIACTKGRAILPHNIFHSHLNRKPISSTLLDRHVLVSHSIGTVVFLHDLGSHGSSLQYANTVLHLSQAQFSVYAPDLRGHGRSDGPRGHIETWTDYEEDLSGIFCLLSDTC